MGNQYVYVNHDEEEYCRFYYDKSRELENKFESRLLTCATKYWVLQPNSHGGQKLELVIKDDRFYGDMLGREDKTIADDYEDVTSNILYFMFESGYEPDRRMMGWIWEQFKDAGKIDQLTKWMEKWED